MTNKVVEDLRKELIESSDEKTRTSGQRFFKEKVAYYGVKTATVSVIGKKYWEIIKDQDKESVFKICEELFKSDFCEEAFIAASWTYKLSGQFEEKDWYIFEGWIKSYINNWAKCDTFCNHSLGAFIEKYPAYLRKLVEWTRSDNRWVKRAAAVSLIVPAKKGKYLTEAFEIADNLINDKDDMVQKGYGWLLKEESRTKLEEVYKFVTERKNIMPRTAYRYAIELMPPTLRAEAMKK